LQGLDLSSTGVDEKCIDSLMQFSKLRRLYITGFSPEALKRLKLASPHLSVSDLEAAN
jgi:hypothetical protein